MAGRLEVITGPMFSGKSEELIRRLTRAQIAGKKVTSFKPKIDNRYSQNEIVSHSGSRIGAISQPNNSMARVVMENYDVIGIDEAQFFDPDDLLEHIKLGIENGKTIIVTGLDLTYRQEPFGIVPTLMAMADRVDKLNAVCAVCGNDAMMTQRLVNGDPAPFDGETIQVGGLDTYEARCRNCFEAA